MKTISSFADIRTPVFLIAVALTVVADPVAAELIFHTTMDSQSDIEVPSVYQEIYSPPGAAIVDAGDFQFVPGKHGNAAQMLRVGSWDFGSFQFKGSNFAYDDPEGNGGRMDMILRFDADPHEYWGPWVFRSTYPCRVMNYEVSNGAFDLFVGNCTTNQSSRTNYGKCRCGVSGDPAWEAVDAGEWHTYTFLWRDNGLHKGEVYWYIDGVLAGKDYNCELPGASDVVAMHVNPDNAGGIPFTIDEIYVFDDWDQSGETGNFADIEFPEGITLKYPMERRGPTWGNPITDTHRPTFEFNVNSFEEPTCECELFVNDTSMGTSTGSAENAHREIQANAAIPNGTHSWYVECDEGRLVSPVNEFVLDSEVGTGLDPDSDVGSVGDLKARF